jgi:hypothetical protein
MDLEDKELTPLYFRLDMARRIKSTQRSAGQVQSMQHVHESHSRSRRHFAWTRL